MFKRKRENNEYKRERDSRDPLARQLAAYWHGGNREILHTE